MQFKVKNTSIKISFSFLALVLFFIITDNLKIFIISFLCAFLHEITHIIFIHLFSGNINYISLSVFGANINRKNTVKSNFCEAIVAVSAPIVNLIIFTICYKFFDDKTLFSKTNLILGVINLLPFENFDGGRFIENVLVIFLNESIRSKILTAISVITTCIITFIAAFLTIKTTEPHPLIILSLFMMLSLVRKN